MDIQTAHLTNYKNIYKKDAAVTQTPKMFRSSSPDVCAKKKTKQKNGVAKAGMSRHITDIPITSLFPADLVSHPVRSSPGFHLFIRFLASHLKRKKKIRTGARARTSRQSISPENTER